MATAPRKRTSTNSGGGTGHVLSERFADPDLVDRLFQAILEQFPEIGGRVVQVKQDLRKQYGGSEHYVRKTDVQTKEQRAAELLRIFDGRNATETARILGIGRATVYRCIKQPGKRQR
jgi:Mor family transcriptional regulator